VIGVLSLQGAFAAHERLLRELGAEPREVRVPADLEGLKGLVLPGGESSVHLRLLEESGLDGAIARFEGSILGTCAGLILLAKRVANPEQRSLGLLDVDVERNGYGRQRDSFEDEEGRVFIRAPRITRVGSGVEVLASREGEPIAVRAGRILGATYHPELGRDRSLHEQLVGGAGVSPARVHLPMDVLEGRFRQLPALPRDEGKVELVVLRPETDERRLPERCRLTVSAGVEGDRWAKKFLRNPGNQVTLIRADVARLVANGQPVELCGDNLHVALDLSVENLPAGTRLRVGTALCQVTPKPHTGCSKFSARFGADARAFTNAASHADQRLRGLHVQVLEDGEVAPGDPIRVVHRP